jgi:hypothetical protein
MNLDVIFASVVGVLAAIAVIGALVLVVVWEVCAIRRTLADHHHRQAAPAERYWREHATVNIPEPRP